MEAASVRAAGEVVSVNVGQPRIVEWFGRQVTTSIWKEPVSAAVTVADVNVEGDDQADRRVHGGPDKAVYAYSDEDYRWWSGELGVALQPGTFGENLTLRGIDLSAAVVGEIWEIGTVRLQVTQPRLPCFKLGIRMGDAGFVERFEAARRFGAYFAIERPGTVAAGDQARRLTRPDGDRLSIAEFIAAHEDGDMELLRRLVDHPHVPPSWRNHAARTLARLARTAR